MRSRGASTVEYALILVAVILLAAGSFKLLGGKVGTRSSTAGDIVASDGARGSGGGGGKGGGGAKGGGGGGSGGGGDKPSVGSKATIGVGPGEGSDNGSNRDTSSEQGAGGNANTKDSGGNADVSETFTPKRWMGIGLLAAGVFAMVYVAASVRRTKKAADAAGGKDPPAGGKPRSRKA